MFEKRMKKLYLEERIFVLDENVLLEEDANEETFQRWFNEMDKEAMLYYVNSLFKRHYTESFFKGMEYQKTNTGLNTKINK